MAPQTRELSGFPQVFRLRAGQQLPTARLEDVLHVNWNDHSYYSDYRPAWRLQRHRWRTVLRHRLLWRRRAGPCDRYPADPAVAGETLNSIASNSIASWRADRYPSWPGLSRPSTSLLVPCR